jgi:gamma-glutamyltranspeptidase/glutathione hydrolase
MHTRHLAFGLLLVGILLACSRVTISDDTVRCQNGAVVCVSEPASQVGLQVLKAGGNSVDAAVATAFALAVTYPPAGNIGGGGYLLVVPQAGAGSAAFDFREVAPAAATREMFVDPAARTPHRRVGVPGTVRGLALAHERFGRLAWRELVLPAVKLAAEGFSLDAALAADLNRTLAATDQTQFAEFHRVFARPDGQPWSAGDRLVQPQLAAVLARIADEGPAGFYAGPVAELIASEMRAGDGLITLGDLAAYEPIEREPLRGSYRGHEVVAVPPSTSGGTTLIESLNALENFDLRRQGRWSPETLHVMIETMKRAFRDRALYLGDPAGNVIPEKLLDKDYARDLAASIDPRRATPSVELAGDLPISGEGEHTTHVSIVDRERTAVSLTYTLENSWGGRVVVRGGGFLLNDEMNDFNWLPGVTNHAGRIGTPANDVAPGKRMLSSMCPVVVRRDGNNLLVTGSPGGRTIINTVLSVVVNVVEFDLPIREAVDSPRLHHQWLPDIVRFEPGLETEYASTLTALRALGHTFARPTVQGDAHSIWIDPATGQIVAAADKRISGDDAGY